MLFNGLSHGDSPDRAERCEKATKPISGPKLRFLCACKPSPRLMARSTKVKAVLTRYRPLPSFNLLIVKCPATSRRIADRGPPAACFDYGMGRSDKMS